MSEFKPPWWMRAWARFLNFLFPGAGFEAGIECTRCGRRVEIGNTAGHEAFYHAPDTLAQVRRLPNAAGK